MKITLSPRSSKGFTLIELIIVIAILATLAGIAYPTYMSIQAGAASTAAKKVCTDIVSAVESFKQDNNGMLPYDAEQVEPDDKDQMFLTTKDGEDANMIKILTNREDDEERRLNSTRDIYLRSDEQDAPRDGLFVDASGGVSFYDPWGAAYYVVLCEEDEGCIDPFGTRRYRGKNCLVYSTGPDQEGAATTAAATGSGKKPKGKAAAEAAAAAAELAEEALEDNVYSWKNQK
ncbi:MAG: prepilin-type N-terminal cleavage/methylation domain-containing protein [Akkermansia sp.]|nr:prepilin-type N-terminal cleavage/methylation domain-containing protein [Akkermansia sp.]